MRLSVCWSLRIHSRLVQRPVWRLLIDLGCMDVFPGVCTLHPYTSIPLIQLKARQIQDRYAHLHLAFFLTTRLVFFFFSLGRQRREFSEEEIDGDEAVTLCTKLLSVQLVLFLIPAEERAKSRYQSSFQISRVPFLGMSLSPAVSVCVVCLRCMYTCLKQE